MEDKSVSTTPKYLIGVVTKLTGLSIDVVRVWERRYGAVSPVRSAGGTRLYSDADVLRLNRLHRAVQRGYGIGQAARLSESELEELIAGDVPAPHDRSDPYRSARERFIAAIRTMDAVEADRELARAATLFSPADLVKSVVSPLVGELNELKARNEIGVAHERVAIGLVRRIVESLIRLYPPSGTRDTLVLAAPSSQLEDFDLLLAALLCVARGWHALYLGADLPASEIALAVRLTNARVLTLNIATESYRANEELKVISTIVPASTQIWIIGAAALRQDAQIGHPNCFRIGGFEEFDERLQK